MGAQRTSRAKRDVGDIVLLCNPQAGGRWKELAGILDSDEARHVRRIVTDSIDDIGPALAGLSRQTKLICIYGGDGTIQRILDQMYQIPREDSVQLAFIGGGTMNVTARWCGLRGQPRRNFRDIIKAYESGQLLLKEVPLLRVRQGETVHRGFTFGIGPIVRVLHAYETSNKGKVAALNVLAKALTAIWSNRPADFEPMLRLLSAEISIDGEPLPYGEFAAVFCNVTGKLHIAVEPFGKPRTRDTFYAAAYAVDKREFALMLPFLIRGHMPFDPMSLLQPVSGWKRLVMSWVGRESFPTDPRYVNATPKSFELRSSERIYTVDGEIIESNGDPITVELGPSLRLAVSPTVDLSPAMRIAAGVSKLEM